MMDPKSLKRIIIKSKVKIMELIKSNVRRMTACALQGITVCLPFFLLFLDAVNGAG